MGQVPFIGTRLHAMELTTSPLEMVATKRGRTVHGKLIMNGHCGRKTVSDGVSLILSTRLMLSGCGTETKMVNVSQQIMFGFPTLIREIVTELLCERTM